MTDLDKAIALLDVLTPQDLVEMDPARRRRFGALCRRAANLAETVGPAIKAGVLFDLRDGHPRHGG